MAVIYDRHLNIIDADKLADYLCKSKIAGRKPFNVMAVGDDYCRGFVNGKEFTICYNYGNSCFLAMEKFTPEEKNSLIGHLNFVMMGSLQGVKTKEKIYCAPIISYVLDGQSIYEWNLYDPEARIRQIKYDAIKYCEDYSNIEVKYPNVDKQELDTVHYYGSKAFFDTETLEEIDTYNEFELYYAIVLTERKIVEIQEEMERGVLEANFEDELESTTYMFYYLLQQTTKFGVASMPLSETIPDLTKQQEAWLKWWHQGYKQWASKHPEEFKKHLNFELEKSPKIKPKGSYKDFLDNTDNEPSNK